LLVLTSSGPILKIGTKRDKISMHCKLGQAEYYVFKYN
jgi:hypothetical protein